MSTKFKDGHKVEFISSTIVCVTDEDGEAVQVDVSKPIVCHTGPFAIPVVGGGWTPAPAEEAFAIAAWTRQEVRAGQMRFSVSRI